MDNGSNIYILDDIKKELKENCMLSRKFKKKDLAFWNNQKDMTKWGMTIGTMIMSHLYLI